MKFVYLLTLALNAYLLSANSRVKSMKTAQWESLAKEGFFQERTSVRNSPVPCVDGQAVVNGEAFPCKNIDFMSYVALPEFEIDTRPHQAAGLEAADIWGWESPTTGKEYALLCVDNGAVFVDVTDPVNPCVTAKLPCPRVPAPWCDIKVFEDVAYIVRDVFIGQGLDQLDVGGQVFDLTRLDGLDCPADGLNAPQLRENFLWDFHGSAHNLVVDTEAGFLYSVGGDICDGGLVMMDLNENKLEPKFVGCVDGDGYTHDAQCVVYDGPDERYLDEEICFAFNEDELTIWLMTNKSDVQLISKMGYPGQVYTHQGWLTDDMSMVLIDDELNELCSLSPRPFDDCEELAANEIDNNTRTSTYFVDVSDLENPFLQGTYRGEFDSIDHNLYFWGAIHRKGWGGLPLYDEIPNVNFAYLHNYGTGLRVFNATSKTAEGFEEIGYFNVAPDVPDLSFLGSWSGYQFLSGTYVVSSIERGLFVLEVTGDLAFIQTTATTPETDDDDDNARITLLLQIGASFLIITIIAVVIFYNVSKPEQSAEQITAVKEDDTEK